MRIKKSLWVAEKPSVAKQILSVLSAGSHRNLTSRNKFCPVYNFKIEIEHNEWDVKLTSVLGHLMTMNFEREYSNWDRVEPSCLLSAKILNEPHPDMQGIVENLTSLARSTDTLVIFTDCDREGEYIGEEIRQICNSANNNLTTQRAYFSSLTKMELVNSIRNLRPLCRPIVESVRTRMELDLRTGASLTRLQTISLRSKNNTDKSVVSYGPCQFPTLGFIVEQYVKSSCFVPESFYTIELTLVIDELSLKWDRGTVFDASFVSIIHGHLREYSECVVSSVSNKEKSKYRPYPLRTVELQKAMSKIHKLSGHRTMQIAEKLYNNGYISYPRTETDRFTQDFDFESIVKRLEDDRFVGQFIEENRPKGFLRPRPGKNDDKAHPPIHPLKSCNELSGDEAKVFEYVARRFIAGISPDAVLHETHIICSIGQEKFSVKGDVIVEPNYLKVFVYDRAQSRELPKLSYGQRVPILSVSLRDGQTSAPLPLSESDLINIMDKNGIGTDATIHEHIQKVLDRGYAVKASDRFIPTALGVGLVVGYDLISPEFSLTKPKSRADLERNLQLICDSAISSSQVCTSHISFFKKILESTAAKIEYVYGSVDFYTKTKELQLPKKQLYESITGSTMANNSRGNNGKDDNRGKAKGQRQANKRRIRKAEESKTEISSEIRCGCGLIAVQLISKRDGSAGRKFLTCGKKVYKCNFFQWLES